MQTLLRAAALALACGSLGACATVVRGTNTTWQVSSSPSGAEVRTSTGLGCMATPCSIRVPRTAEFTATVSKTGFEPTDVHVSHAISAPGAVALAGNVLIGGLVGIVVDAATGAMNDVTPNNTMLELKPLGRDPLATYDLMSPVAAFAPPPAALVRTGGVSSDEGRVVEYKLLANGTVRELRE